MYECKIIALLSDDIDILPVSKTKYHTDKHNQTRWLTSMSVILQTIYDQASPFLELEIYGPEDLEFMQVIHERVQITMTHLLEDGVFDDKDMCSILASFIFYMEHIGKWFNRLIKAVCADHIDDYDGEVCPQELSSTPSEWEIFTSSEMEIYKNQLNTYVTKYNIERIIETHESKDSATSNKQGVGNGLNTKYDDADGSDEKVNDNTMDIDGIDGHANSNNSVGDGNSDGIH
jgi:hypothetical protein